MVDADAAPVFDDPDEEMVQLLADAFRRGLEPAERGDDADDVAVRVASAVLDVEPESAPR